MHTFLSKSFASSFLKSLSAEKANPYRKADGTFGSANDYAFMVGAGGISWNPDVPTASRRGYLADLVHHPDPSISGPARRQLWQMISPSQPRDPTPSATTDEPDWDIPVKAKFTTTQGSKYVFDGTRTQRAKTSHQFHPTSDVGKKTPSDFTIFVSPNVATEIGMHNALNREARPRVYLEGDAVVLESYYGKNPQTGESFAYRHEQRFPFEKQPRLGAAPVEFWPDGKNHPGNTITALESS